MQGSWRCVRRIINSSGRARARNDTMATKKMAASFIGYFANLAPGNATKLERNEKKRAEREPIVDTARG